MLTGEQAVKSGAARQVLEILAQGFYVSSSGARVEIGDTQAASVQGTRLYSPDDLAELRGRSPIEVGGEGRVDVVAGTTQEALVDLSSAGDVVLLNFASARNPGGGFLGGARAQEEDLCRCSGLYPTLLTQQRYYDVNRKNRSLSYSDYLIYSPRVPFFRTSGDAPMLEQPLLASVITAPAPNLGAMLQQGLVDAAEVRSTFLRRWANVLAAAEVRGHRTVLLGAWGCGAFRNDPQVVAETAREVVRSDRYARSFDRIVFAIPGSGRISQANLERFRSVLP